MSSYFICRAFTGQSLFIVRWSGTVQYVPLPGSKAPVDFVLSQLFFSKQMQIEFWWTAHSSRIGNSNSEIVMNCNCNQNVQQWNKDWDVNKCSQCCSFLHLTWPKSGNLARTKNNQSLNVASHWMFQVHPPPLPLFKTPELPWCLFVLGL